MTFLLVLALVAQNPDPKSEVLAAIESQRSAWNRGDLDQFCALYAEDAAFISPKGLTRGRAEVLSRYKKRYPNKNQMGTLTFEHLDVRADATHASVAAKWTLSYEHKPKASGFTLIVWEKRAGKWTLTQDASM